MRVLANRRVKSLFLQMTCCVALFSFISVGFPKSVCVPALGVLMLALCYQYFREQDRMLEDAAGRIREFVSGDRSVRIACDEEGELYRLFHEINSLAAILNAQAEKEGKAKEFLRNIISDISHQLKTPLAALNIYNGIMQDEAKTNGMATIGEFVELSEQELDRMETLTQKLLKITKFDAGSVVIEKRRENISEMMADVQKRFAFRAAQEGKEIFLSGDETLSFSCDRNWIEEAADNIVKNALDHMERGDCVRIEWKQTVSVVQIAIKDNGSGIHPEDLYHIFKRFYRSRYSQNTQGIGLGLPLAKAVVEAHNGTIEVDSQLGAGTTFVIKFFGTENREK